jgi:hypothetical protein
MIKSGALITLLVTKLGMPKPAKLVTLLPADVNFLAR